MMAFSITRKLTNLGFISAGLANIGGVLLFSKCFTNKTVNQADPVVMSNFGLTGIILWGLAYIATTQADSKGQQALARVFVIEKLVYVVAWLIWQSKNDLKPVFKEDFLAGAFYSVYGINDFIFMLFFLYVALKNTDEQKLLS